MWLSEVQSKFFMGPHFIDPLCRIISLILMLTRSFIRIRCSLHIRGFPIFPVWRSDVLWPCTACPRQCFVSHRCAADYRASKDVQFLHKTSQETWISLFYIRSCTNPHEMDVYWIYHRIFGYCRSVWWLFWCYRAILEIYASGRSGVVASGCSTNCGQARRYRRPSCIGCMYIA